MLEELFSQVYTKFKMHFYREVFSRFQSREASLTAVETLCMEVIAALKDPTSSPPLSRSPRPTRPIR